MDMQKTLIVRILVVAVVIYAAWNFGLRPKLNEQAQLKETRIEQLKRIADSGQDFEIRQAETKTTHEKLSAVGGQMLETLSSTEDQRSARELITTSANTFGVAVNRVEPLRVIEFSSVTKKKRFGNSGSTDPVKGVKFKGEGVRVEFEGSFAGIAGLLQQLDIDTKTLKLENFRMVSSADGGVRMIAQFMNFELAESSIVFTDQQIAGADSAASGG